MPRVLPRDPKRERFWRATLARFATADLNVRDFCRRHRLAETAFYVWRREIAARDRQPGQPPAAPEARPSPRPKSGRTPARPIRPTFVPVRVVPGRPLEIVLRSGHTLRLPPGYDPAHVRAVVAAPEADGC